jgi:1-deoxy-D-xylulose-5-phosphate synthase
MPQDITIPNLHDIKLMNTDELVSLAQTLRTFVLQNVSKTGGHLGANLGVVELTLALHYVFDSPNDGIIWDIGHQSYIHKILTDRSNKFHTLRSYGGISGFTNPEESPHDLFFAGHSSTSVSLGIGLATAKQIAADDSYTISIIGDGAISAGMAFEAMNNISIANNKFITILNDNDMSISAPTGALSKYLPKLFISYGYQGVKSISKKFLAKFPDKFFNLFSRLHKSFKGFISGNNFFEELGYDYIGPIDGHDIKGLVNILQIIKKNAHKPSFYNKQTNLPYRKGGKEKVGGEGKGDGGHGDGSEVMDLDLGDPEATRVDLSYRDRWWQCSKEVQSQTSCFHSS